MKTKIITEGNAKIKTYLVDEVSKEMPVFYNPVMEFNRDMSVLLLDSIEKKNLQIGLPLAGTGVRGVRLLTELSKGKIISIQINDKSPDAVKLIKKNIELNEDNLNCDDIEVSQLDANIFLLESSGFDHIDLDVFGSPNFMLDSSITRISRGGILAVTATDTAPLCGTYPKTCKRKYFSSPIRNEHMHEIGLRILIRKVQLIGAQYEKALTPVFSYYKDHYFRAFFLCEKSNSKVDEIIKNHGYFHYCSKCTNHFTSKANKETCCKKVMDFAGPIFSDKINDFKLINDMIKKSKTEKNNKFLQTILDESIINNVGFFDIHKTAKKYRIDIPRTEEILKKLKEKGFKTARTHFNIYGIKTDAKIGDFVKIIRNQKPNRPNGRGKFP